MSARRASSAGDQQPVDFVRPLEDPVHARVAVVAFGGVVAHEAVAAVDLDVLVEDEVQGLAARDLQDRRLDREFLECGQNLGWRVAGRQRAVDEPRRAVQHRFHGVLPRDHLAELVTDRAERRDRLAELLARWPA